MRYSSDVWRILNVDEDATVVWDVQSLNLYDNAECSGPTLTSADTVSNYIDSGHLAGGGYGPEKAFDNNPDSIWGGRPDGSNNLYLGVIFKVNVEVKCAVFLDGNSNGQNISKQATLQMQDDNQNWVDVESLLGRP